MLLYAKRKWLVEIGMVRYTESYGKKVTQKPNCTEKQKSRFLS